MTPAAPKAIHMMIRVKEEARSVAFYADVFGLSVAERVEFETFILVYLHNAGSDFELELTVNKDRNEPYDMGTGYGHLAFVVDDLKALHLRLTLQGFTPKDIKQMAHHGRLFGEFFFIDDPDGYKIEVLKKGWRFK